MTIFDRLGFEQRAYAIQQLETLTAMLKEANFADTLSERGLMIGVGQPKIEDVQRKILEFALNHFGMPYSHEANEEEG